MKYKTKFSHHECIIFFISFLSWAHLTLVGTFGLTKRVKSRLLNLAACEMHTAKFAMNTLINLSDKYWACSACRQKTNAKSQEGYAAANKKRQRWFLHLNINSVGEMPLRLCVQLLSAHHKAVQVLQTLQTASSTRTHTNSDLSSLAVPCSPAGSSGP